eukprot:SAG31_NODE_271_length_18717_cov_8.685949_26_plen_120_part_01
MQVAAAARAAATGSAAATAALLVLMSSNAREIAAVLEAKCFAMWIRRSAFRIALAAAPREPYCVIDAAGALMQLMLNLSAGGAKHGDGAKSAAAPDLSTADRRCRLESISRLIYLLKYLM